MKALLLSLAAAIVICAPCGCATNSELLRVPIQDLAAQKTQLLGTTLVTQGCLSDSHHGAYIRPCDETAPYDLTLVTDPSNKIPELFMRVLGHLGGEMEVVATGSLVRVPADQQIYLELRSIDVVRKHEP